MDNDTIEMTCERVEDELSGYLDDVLDPQLRRAVATHLATCDRCSAILADFQRGDELLRALPFIEPPPDMRERFFESPRYLKLANARARQRNYVTPLAGALVAAAMLVLALGGALLFRQGFFVSQQASSSGTSDTIGNAGGSVVPLPAGSRLIYERGGALWSAPASGVGLPRQLTTSGIQVAGWHVSPDGRMVIYIDARTGALHIVRADALNDRVIGTVTGGSAVAADFWTTSAGASVADGIAWSPDNTRVAYVARSMYGTALHVMNVTGAADTVASPAGGALIGHLRWSPDSVYIAYTATLGASQQRIAVYNVTTGFTAPVAAHSDASDASAVVEQLVWVPGASALTWSTRAGDLLTGVFRADARQSDSATRLTPVGMAYTAADVSATGGWLLANGSTLSEVAAGQTTPQTAATLAHPVTLVRWAPSGQIAAVVSDGTLDLLTSNHSLVTVARGQATLGLVAWSSVSDALAWQSADQVMSVTVHQGAVGEPRVVAQRANVQALAWSPDGQTIAVRSSTGVLLAASDGAHIRAADNQATSSGEFSWSLAG